MENAMMESKQTIIGNLYSIRAGLSYISQIADKMEAKLGAEKRLQKEIDVCKNKISSLKNSITEAERNIRYLRGKEGLLMQDKATKESWIASLEVDLAKDRERSLLTFDDDRYNGSFKCRLAWFLVPFIIFLGLAAMVIVALITKSTTLEGILSAFVYVGIADVVVLIVNIVKFSKKIKELKRNKKDQLEKSETQIRKEKEKLANIESEIASVRVNAPRQIQELEEKIKKTENEIKELEAKIPQLRSQLSQCHSEYTALKKKGQTFANGLVAVYGEFCHPDNWQYIDRILYYLSTGRAETLREALILMDQRLNAELIANEIRQSSAMIAGEIQRSSKTITAAISWSAEHISDAIYTTGAALVESGDRIAENLATANSLAAENVETTKMLVREQELSNALQRKANATMDQLMTDYRRVNNL